MTNFAYLVAYIGFIRAFATARNHDDESGDGKPKKIKGHKIKTMS